MKNALAPTLFLTLLLGAPVAASRIGSAPVQASERASLQALHASGAARLQDLRAGAPAVRASLDQRELAALRAASRPELASLRAGDLNLTNDELTIVLITVVAVLLIIAIA